MVRGNVPYLFIFLLKGILIGSVLIGFLQSICLLIFPSWVWWCSVVMLLRMCIWLMKCRCV